MGAPNEQNTASGENSATCQIEEQSDCVEEVSENEDEESVEKGEGSPEVSSEDFPFEESADCENGKCDLPVNEKAIGGKFSSKLILIAAVVVAFVAIVAVAVTVAVPSMRYADAKQAMKEGDYSRAIELFGESKKDDFEKYISYCNGMIQLQSGEYLSQKDAVESFKESSGIEDSDQRVKEAYYRLGVNRLEAADVSTASDYFSKADGYEDSAAKKEYCDNAEKLVKAEKEYDDGNLGGAQKAFGELPADFEYDGISVASRLEALSSNQSLVDLCGTWSSTSSSATTKQIWVAGDGRYEYWDWDDFGIQSMKVKCVINDDGTLTISGNVPYDYPINFSTISAALRTSSDSIDFSQTGSSIPEVLYDDGETKLTFDGSAFRLSYYKYSDNESINFDYEYSSEYVFDNKI